MPSGLPPRNPSRGLENAPDIRRWRDAAPLPELRVSENDLRLDERGKGAGYGSKVHWGYKGWYM